jgi:hypothetical protein
MSNSLQKHGAREINKQLRFRMMASGLETIKIHVARRAGKFQISFTGSAEQVAKADHILATWG